MKQKIAFMIDRQLLAFMDLQAQGNRSEYLNSLLHRERQLVLKQKIITAQTEDLQDPIYLAEISEWDQL
jgi:hypothetical protein